MQYKVRFVIQRKVLKSRLTKLIRQSLSLYGCVKMMMLCLIHFVDLHVFHTLHIILSWIYEHAVNQNWLLIILATWMRIGLDAENSSKFNLANACQSGYGFQSAMCVLMWLVTNSNIERMQIENVLTLLWYLSSQPTPNTETELNEALVSYVECSHKMSERQRIKWISASSVQILIHTSKYLHMKWNSFLYEPW